MLQCNNLHFILSLIYKSFRTFGLTHPPPLIFLTPTSPKVRSPHFSLPLTYSTYISTLHFPFTPLHYTPPSFKHPLRTHSPPSMNLPCTPFTILHLPFKHLDYLLKLLSGLWTHFTSLHEPSMHSISTNLTIYFLLSLETHVLSLP
jgi:hypothetical protein